MSRVIVVIIRQLLYLAGTIAALHYSEMLRPFVDMFQTIMGAENALPAQIFVVLFLAIFFFLPVIRELLKLSGNNKNPDAAAVDKPPVSTMRDNTQRPDQPINGNKQPGIINMLVGACLLVFGGLIATSAVAASLEQGKLFGLIALLLPLVGILLLIKGWKVRRHSLTDPQDSVVLTPYPGQVGGQIAGHVAIPTAGHTSPEALNRDYTVAIKLMKTSTSGSAGDRRTSTAIVSEKTLNSHPEAANNGIKVPFTFSIPKGFPESRPGTGDGYWYQLEVHSDDQRYSNSFELPVFNKTDGLDEELALESSSPGSDLGEPAPQVNHNMTPIEIDSGKPAMGWMLVLMGFMFGGAGVVLSFIDSAPAIFPLVFVPVGGLILALGILSSVTRYHTRITAQGVTHVTYRFGKPTSQRGWKREQLTALHLKIGGSSTVNGRMTEYYQLLLRTNDDQDLNIEFGLKGREAALDRMKTLGQQAALAIRYTPLAPTHSSFARALMLGRERKSQ